MFTFPYVPKGSVLGLNYSGAHDSAIAIVAPDGRPVFALSLERLTRVKQDGRWPEALLGLVPWDRISSVVLSTYENIFAPEQVQSRFLTTQLPTPRAEYLVHAREFHANLSLLPCPLHYAGHQHSHAYLAFYGSGFENSLCLTYDGGMHNDPWFGGVFQCARGKAIAEIDLFEARHYAKITSLYTFITALLGFKPNRHEGKITGLAAFGTPKQEVLALLNSLLTDHYFAFEATLQWLSLYSKDAFPVLHKDDLLLAPFKEMFSGHSREDVAASLQRLSEDHVLALLQKVVEEYGPGHNLCLSGGLFSNVKVNQRISGLGFGHIFVSPPMTDDGTALGAAWSLLSREPHFNPPRCFDARLGPAYSKESVLQALEARDVRHAASQDPAQEIARLLASGHPVALFQGAAEFGPRALGNRSILAPASVPGMSDTLNAMLNRTEFMPFAPVTLDAEADGIYHMSNAVLPCVRYMTIAVDCKDSARASFPAIVHVDGTARPQVVSRDDNQLLYEILLAYKALTGASTVINTSFNVHEKPIVCSPDDALDDFFESGLQHLYLEGAGLVPMAGNEAAALSHLRKRLKQPQVRPEHFHSIVSALSAQRQQLSADLADKQEEINYLSQECEGRLDLIHRLEEDTHVLEEALYGADKKGSAAQAPAGGAQPPRARALARGSNAQPELLASHERRLAGLESQLATLLEVIEKRVALPFEAGSQIALLQEVCDARQKVIEEQQQMLKSLHVRLYSRLLTLGRVLLQPKLGDLHQHPPIPLLLPSSYWAAPRGSHWPKISIITPSYMQGEYLEQTLLSVLDQQYPELEYFVQDGGSTDSTVEVLLRYEKQLLGWESRPDKGQSNAINLGFAHTRGEIMAWLNSDDLLLPGALAYVARYFEEHPEVDVVYGNRMLINGQGRQIGRWVLPGHDNAVLAWADFVPQETLFWRRSAWDKVGGAVDESFRFAMDWDFLLRLREAGACFRHLPRHLGAFRVHEQQKTSAAINAVGFDEMTRLRKRCHGRVVEHSEIAKRIAPYILRHLLADFLDRVRFRLSSLRPC